MGHGINNSKFQGHLAEESLQTILSQVQTDSKEEERRISENDDEVVVYAFTVKPDRSGKSLNKKH